MGEEFGVTHDAVELVAVEHEQALTREGKVLGFGAKFDAGDFQAHR